MSTFGKKNSRTFKLVKLSVEVLFRKQFGGTFKKSGIDFFCCSISTPWPVEGVAVTILSSCVDTTSREEACRRNSDFEDNILGLTLC